MLQRKTNTVWVMMMTQLKMNAEWILPWRFTAKSASKIRRCLWLSFWRRGCLFSVVSVWFSPHLMDSLSWFVSFLFDVLDLFQFWSFLREGLILFWVEPGRICIRYIAAVLLRKGWTDSVGYFHLEIFWDWKLLVYSMYKDCDALPRFRSWKWIR